MENLEPFGMTEIQKIIQEQKHLSDIFGKKSKSEIKQIIFWMCDNYLGRDDIQDIINGLQYN